VKAAAPGSRRLEIDRRETTRRGLRFISKRIRETGRRGHRGTGRTGSFANFTRAMDFEIPETAESREPRAAGGRFKIR